MDEEINNEGITSQMTPDEAAAALAFATNLSTQSLKQQNPPIQQEVAEAPAEVPEEKPEVDIDKLVEEKVSKVLKEEMAGLRKELKEMLDEEEGED